MDKKDLKKILKPLMKECVKELLMEEGMFKVLSEVVHPVRESRQQNLGKLEPQQLENVRKTYPQGTLLHDDSQESRKKLVENHKKMLEEIGKSSYLNGVNPFEGTQPLSEAQAPDRQPGEITSRTRIPPALKDVDPTDPGVDIRGIMNLAAGKWKTLGRKG